MGKASRRKRGRRKAGYNKKNLQSLRDLVAMARVHGGMIRLAHGDDGVNTHYVVLHALRPPETLCQLQPDELKPADGVEITCMLCSSISKQELQKTQWELAAANMAATAEAENTIKRYGG